MLANIPRLRELMEREGLDAVIATCPENVTYLSGFWAMSQWVRRGPQAYVLFPKGNEQPCVVANSGILDLVADQDIWVSEIRRYGYFQMDIDPSATLDSTDRMQKQLFGSEAYKGSVEALVTAMKEKASREARSASTKWASRRSAWTSSDRCCRTRLSCALSRCSSACAL